MEAVEHQIEAIKTIITEAQKSLGVISPTAPPTAAPTPAPTNATIVLPPPRKSPVEWEAELQKHDKRFVNEIKHETDEHLTVATQVVKGRGPQPIPSDAAEAAALARDADDLAQPLNQDRS